MIMELVFRDVVFFIQFVFVAINLHVDLAGAEIGVNYGMKANNLPSAKDVIELYQERNIKLLRLFEPHPEALHALRGSGIKVMVGVKNVDVARLASDPYAAIEWVKTNVAAYSSDVNFGWIAVGNEMVPGPNAEHIPAAMNNILSGLTMVGLTGIKVSTVVSSKVLGVSNPPSTGDFTNEAKTLMSNITTWLRGTDNPTLLINVYPYFTYVSDPTNIPLDYALCNAAQPKIDGQYKYYCLYESMVDAFYVALEKNGLPGANVVVTETGWPSAGQEPHTSNDNARIYNQRVIVKSKLVGTPRRPNTLLDVFIFAMFNENLKPAGVEQNWGICYPDKSPVYPLVF